jgi:hypothetical protein
MHHKDVLALTHIKEAKLKATFSNISAILWRPVLVVEEGGENHRSRAS